MRRDLICLTIPILLLTGCVNTPPRHVEEIVYEQGKLQKYSYYDASRTERSGAANLAEVADIIKQADPTALKELDEVGIGSTRSVTNKRAYTGIIRNLTNHELAVPSQNSQGTLLIPPRGYIEYTVWDPHVKFSPYLDGKPYRCFSMMVKPKAYEYMCNKYDFMAVIEPKGEPEGHKKYKKRVRKQRPC